MTNTSRTIWSIALLAALAAAPDEAPAQAGSSGMAFLKLGVSGEAVAMGEASVATIRGAAATYYNPAGLVAPDVDSSSVQLLFTHKSWIQDTRMEFLGASVRIGESNAIGLSVNSTTVSDIEIRTRPGTAEGTFTSRDFSVGLSYAHKFSEDLQLGTTIRYLYEKIYVDETNGFAVDIGAHYVTPLERLTVGLALSNLGSSGGFRNENITLPALMRLGPAYSFDLKDAHATVSASVDYVRIFPEKTNYLNTGAEFMFERTIAARVGYQFGSEARGFCSGIGIRYRLFLLDYAYAPLSQDLGKTHTITIGVNL
jgi:hypothetical protein